MVRTFALVFTFLLIGAGVAFAKVPDRLPVTEEYARGLSEGQLYDGISGRGEYAQWQLKVGRKEVLYGLTDGEKSIFREELIRRNPDWSDDAKEDIQNGTISRGMTTAQALASWGSPTTIERPKARRMNYERWVYQLPYGKEKFFYVRDDIVTSAF